MIDYSVVDINLFQIIIYTIIGAGTGIIAGLVPSINITITILILFPFLHTLDVYTLISFYISLLVTSQYLGSVIASSAGIPGEASSIPAVKEGYSMNMNGKLHIALRTSAIASVLGSFVAILMVLLTITFLEHLYEFYALRVQATLLSLCVIITCLTSNNKTYTNIILMSVGYIVGLAGITQTRSDTWYTSLFDIQDPFLMTGIPMTVAFIFLYALPTLLGNRFNKQNNLLQIKEQKEKFNLKKFPYLSTVRGSIIGFFAGLIPNITFTISSQLAYSFEKILKKGRYKIGDEDCLATAEASNNSAIVSFLMPLLIFGIPIAASEMLIYDMAVNKGAMFSIEWFTNSQVVTLLVISFVLANFIGFITAYPLADKITKFVFMHDRKIFYVAFLLLIVTVLSIGSREYQLLYYISLSAILLPVSWFLRKFDCIPLIIGFMLSIHFERIISQILIIYF